MIYSSFKQHIEITLTDLIFQIKGHGGISITKGEHLPHPVYREKEGLLPYY